DFHHLVPQLQDFTAYRREEDRRHTDRLGRAVEALRQSGPAWARLSDDAQADAARLGRRAPLRGLPLGRFDAPLTCAPCPRPVTVVATDGSQIFPERGVEPACYLLNVSRLAFQYGTEEPPLLVAEPELRFRARDLEDLSPDGEAAPFDVTTEVVSALRDEAELRWLFETAVEARRPARPLVALADGTLIRWMLRGMKNRTLEETLVGRYLAELDRFRAEGIPVASYVSQPGNAEVVGLLRFVLGEDPWHPGPDSLKGLLDRHLFEAVLSVGARSALFESGSQILRAYGEAHHIVYFYLRLEHEVARVELPRWVAEQPG